MRALLVTLLAAGSVLVIGATPAYACSCDPGSAAEKIAYGNGAIVGTYLGRTEPVQAEDTWHSATPVVNHFSVERAVRGTFGTHADVVAPTSGISCGLELAIGQRTGLIVRSAGSGWESNLCLQTDPDALLAVAVAPPGPAPALEPQAEPILPPPPPPAPAAPPPLPPVKEPAPRSAGITALRPPGADPPATRSSPEVRESSPSSPELMAAASESRPVRSSLPILLLLVLATAGLGIALKLRGRSGAQ